MLSSGMNFAVVAPGYAPDLSQKSVENDCPNSTKITKRIE
jgi:hypothetical protein